MFPDCTRVLAAQGKTKVKFEIWKRMSKHHAQAARTESPITGQCKKRHGQPSAVFVAGLSWMKRAEVCLRPATRSLWTSTSTRKARQGSDALRRFDSSDRMWVNWLELGIWKRSRFSVDETTGIDLVAQLMAQKPTVSGRLFRARRGPLHWQPIRSAHESVI